MSESVYAGLTSQTIDVFLGDSSSTTGGGLTGLAFNTASLTCYYRKGATGTPTAITLATQTVGGAWSSGGFVQVDSTNMPGVYRFDIPNVVVDTEGFATVYFRGAANLVPTAIRIDCRALPADMKKLIADGQSATDLKDFVDTGYDPSTNKVQGVATTDTVTTLTGHTPQTGDSFARLGAPAGASVAADIAAVLAKWTTAVTESYAADGAEPTPEQALMMILQSIHEFAVASTTRTVKKLDGVTTAMTFTLDSATAPTSTTRAT